jgi:hypothetical protein
MCRKLPGRLSVTDKFGAAIRRKLFSKNRKRTGLQGQMAITGGIGKGIGSTR